MKKVLCLSFALLLISCGKDKKLTEVELPSPEEMQTVISWGNPEDVKAEPGQFQMPGLPYSYQSLEPYIDGRTMELHYAKHHLGYTNKLNKAIKGTLMQKMNIEDILAEVDATQEAIRNNAGGFYNHNLFWESLQEAEYKSRPQGKLLTAIQRDFGSVNAFEKQFKETANTQFGSAWVWLVANANGELQIVSTPNQDNPLMKKLGYNGTPLLGIDLWEHAYYLNYQNKRHEYVDGFFNYVNWNKIAERYLELFPEPVETTPPTAPATVE